MKTLIAIPCMDMVHTTFLRSMLGLRRVGDVRFSLTSSSLVYDARNRLAVQAIDEGFDRILWLDSDMDFPSDTMIRLMEDLDEGKEIVGGLYFKRVAPITPVVFERCGIHDGGDGTMTPVALPYEDYPRDQLFPVEGIGFGCVMMTTDLARRVREQYGLPFSPATGFGEDLTFCLRARALGAEIWCDSRVKCGHVAQGNITEETYLSSRGGSME